MDTKMITLSKIEAKRGMEILMKDIPSINEDEILVKVLAASVCGTDVHIYTWDKWAENRIKKIPQTMGHELAGEVVKIGKRVNTLKIGDIVSAETHIVCGVCEFCLTGRAHICINTSVLGVDRDGAFAQYIAIPAVNAWKNDPSIPPEYLSIQEPLGNAVHTVLAQDVIGKTVAVVGVGPIGIMAVDVAKAVGASRVFAIDVNAYRLDLAKKIGADVCLNALDGDIVQRVKDLTGGAGVDVVCEMSGNGIALNQALEYLKLGGHLSILGVPTKKIEIDVTNHIVFKGITIHGITGRKMYETWFQVKGLIQSGKLHLKDIVTHKLHYSEYEKAMSLMESGNCGKIVLMFNQEKSND
jgi:threonine 3-dehydrogenase